MRAARLHVPSFCHIYLEVNSLPSTAHRFPSIFVFIVQKTQWRIVFLIFSGPTLFFKLSNVKTRHFFPIRPVCIHTFIPNMHLHKSRDKFTQNRQTFRQLFSSIFRADMQRPATSSKHHPELIMQNFTTRLGARVEVTWSAAFHHFLFHSDAVAWTKSSFLHPGWYFFCSSRQYFSVRYMLSFLSCPSICPIFPHHSLLFPTVRFAVFDIFW